MKKLLCLLLAGASLFANESNKEDVAPVRLGLGPVLASDGFGLSTRLWIRDALGFSLNVTSCWDRETEGGELQLNYKFNTPTLFKPYLLAGGGVQRLNLKDIGVYNEPVGTVTGGAGVEALLGKSKRHGLSVEVAYTYGKIEYSAGSTTAVGENVMSNETKSESVTPFSVGALYHFYFIPAGEKDSDRDGILNSNDKCPDKAEDVDGFNDEDGCPEFDNDNDGIADSLDKCKNEPEDMDSFEDEDGCPEDDNDKDGIVDSKDSCPDKAETLNEYKDLDGCPDSKPVEKVKIEKIIKEEMGNIPVDIINFKLGSAELTDTSKTIVTTLAEFMKKWPDVKIEVQGHTDNSGPAAYNKAVSQQRADAVMKALVENGIDKMRLTAVGYGQEKPLVSNDTREGRIKNRRVEVEIMK